MTRSGGCSGRTAGRIFARQRMRHTAAGYIPGAVKPLPPEASRVNRASVATIALCLLAGPLSAQIVDGRCAKGPGDDRTIQVAATLRQPMSVVRGVVDSVLRAHYSLDSALTTTERFVTAVSARWPAGTETERWHGEAHPGVRVTVTLATWADSTRATITAHVVCLLDSLDADAQPGSVSSMLEVMSAVQVAAGIADRFRQAK